MRRRDRWTKRHTTFLSSRRHGGSHTLLATKMEWHALIRVGPGCLRTRRRVESQCGFTVGAHTIGRQWQEKLWGLLGSLLRWPTWDTYRYGITRAAIGPCDWIGNFRIRCLFATGIKSVVPGNKNRSDDVPVYDCSQGFVINGRDQNEQTWWRTLAHLESSPRTPAKRVALLQLRPSASLLLVTCCVCGTNVNNDMESSGFIEKWSFLPVEN